MYLIQMWDGDDEDGDDERGHDEDLEEPEAVVNSGANALARRHPNGHEAHGQEEEPDREGNLQRKKVLEVSKFFENFFILNIFTKEQFKTFESSINDVIMQKFV